MIRPYGILDETSSAPDDCYRLLDSDGFSMSLLIWVSYGAGYRISVTVRSDLPVSTVVRKVGPLKVATDYKDRSTKNTSPNHLSDEFSRLGLILRRKLHRTTETFHHRVRSSRLPPYPP